MTRVLTDRDSDEMPELSPEEAKVIDWRFQWLCAAGYTKRNARLIASETKIDWRFASTLRKNCDDEELAMRILF